MKIIPCLLFVCLTATWACQPKGANGHSNDPAPAASETTPGAAPSSVSESTPTLPLTATVWKLVEMNGETMSGKTAKEMNIMFDPSMPQMKGHTGCNTIFGEFKTDAAGNMRFVNIITTSMECATPNIEADYLKALDEVREYKLQGDRLDLGKKSNTPSLRFVAGAM